MSKFLNLNQKIISIFNLKIYNLFICFYNNKQTTARLDPKDEKLLEEESASLADLKRAEQHNKMVSWMRRNEYISTETTRFQPKQYDAAESK